jgi:hypothetical protein
VIDRRNQGRSHGSAALRLVIEQVRTRPADRQIGYGARAFPHAVIDLDEIRRSRQRSPL